MSAEKLPVRTRAGRSSATWTIAAPAADLPMLVEQAVGSVSRFTLTGRSADSVVLSCGANARTWGGTLTLTFGADGANSMIAARWQPLVPTTLVDWGQGASDIRAIHAVLDEAAARP